MTGALRLVVTSIAALGLLAPSATADVRIDPAQAALSTGALWLLLGGGVLALWAAAAFTWRLMRGTSAPRLTRRTVRNVAIVAALGWIATTAVLLLFQGRPRRDFAYALNDVSTMVWAQGAYQSVNQGLFEGDPRCLNVPSRCIPGYAVDAPTFIEPYMAALRVDRGGYRRVFYPGAAAAPDLVRAGRVSPSSVVTWAYTAVPLVLGPNGGASYCGDSTGMVCRINSGAAPDVRDGACVLATKVCERIR